MYQQFNDFELIKLVERFPVLYAKGQTRDHKNAVIKDEAWRKVSEVLQKSERACITRWKSIRDRFGKELRQLQKQPDEPTNWDLFPHLLFLQDHYKQGNSFAKIDFIENVKYEPKARKGKSLCSIDKFNEDDSQNFNRSKEDSEEDVLLNRELIQLVRDHDVLYDCVKVRDSKNLAAKNEAWQEISCTLGITEKDCYTKWRKLRNRFPHEYRKYCLNRQEITWTYFQDLMFLSNHYRKGKSKVLEANHCKSEVNKSTSPCSIDFAKVISSDYDENELITENHDSTLDSNDTQEQCLDDLLHLHAKNTSSLAEVDSPVEVSCMSSESVPSSTSNDMSLAITLTEQKLSSVIANIEVALKQSQDCLKNLQQQKYIKKPELAKPPSVGVGLQCGLMQKINVLLDGMQVEQRSQAENKILEFLRECQVKVLNNEEIEDVSSIDPF